MREFCGVYGIYSFESDSLSKMVYYGLYALQHRGQESAGIAVSDGRDIKIHKGMGLCAVVFNEKILKSLTGHIACGHVRYSTTGGSTLENAQPVVVDSKFGPLALCHNGNLINSGDLRMELEEEGHIFQSTTDSEVIAVLISRSKEETLEKAIADACEKAIGGFSLVIMTKDKLVGVRDPNGIRPLCIGRHGSSYVISSESAGLDVIGADFMRDVSNGEIVIIDEEGLRSITYAPRAKKALCAFEFIYLARPDSKIEGRTVFETRAIMGKYLAKDNKVDADIVIGVPDSGVAAAIGYAQESKIPFAEGLIKNRYIGRTFIQPSQAIRDLGVKLKLNPIRDIVRGKKIVIIDDSIVRGTTSKQIVKILREAGAREIHMRVSSPPILFPCFYGIDTPSKAELIASTTSVEGVRQFLEADSLSYLTIRNLINSINLPKNSLCLACLNGNYCVKIPERIQNLSLVFR
ncbi:MAG: amidophosphoribosyltransferase [bacterium]